ncbi:MAG: hypothetical protein ACRYFW_00295 [Janthinobacterium lividum]
MTGVAGPSLERLTRRLAETPAEFLAEPRIGDTGTLAVAALVGDLLAQVGGRPDLPTLNRFVARDARADRNRLAVTAIIVWLLADEWFAHGTLSRDAVLRLIGDGAATLAATSPAHAFAADGERREELARTALATLGLLPEGETAAQAADRLSAVSAAERQRLLAASRAAEERARTVREALIRKAAEESADKWTRE